MIADYDKLEVPANYIFADGTYLMTIAECKVHLQLLNEACRRHCNRAARPDPIGMRPGYIIYRIARHARDETKLPNHEYLGEHGSENRDMIADSPAPSTQDTSPTIRHAPVLLNGVPVPISTPSPATRTDTGSTEPESDRLTVRLADQFVQHVRTRRHLIITESQSAEDQIVPGMHIAMLKSVRQSIEVLEHGGVCQTADLFSDLSPVDTDLERHQ